MSLFDEPAKQETKGSKLLSKFAAKEKLEIVNARGAAAHFCPPTQSEPREARRGNSVRAILKIHRPSAFFMVRRAHHPEFIEGSRDRDASYFANKNEVAN